MEIGISDNKRVFGLDVMRALAILSVLFGHTAEFLNPLSSLPALSDFHFWMDDLRPLGPLGVELFFALSGFLIGGILVRAYMSAETFSFAVVNNFWVRRWFRTLPNYWLILIANLIINAAIWPGKFPFSRLLFFPFMQNVVTPHPPYFFGEAWSLSVEEWFYLTLPAALFILSLVAKPANKAKFLFRVFLGYMLIFILLRFVNAFRPIYGPEQDAGIRKVVIFRLDAIVYGVMFAWYNYFRKEQLQRLKYPLALLGAIGIAVLYYFYLKPELVISTTNPHIRFFSDAFFYLFLPLSCSFCLPLANSVKQISSRWITNVIQYISKVSYSLYLVHYSVVYIYIFSRLKVTTPGHTVLLYIGYLAIVFVLATLLYTFVEQPVMRYRDKVTQHK